MLGSRRRWRALAVLTACLLTLVAALASAADHRVTVGDWRFAPADLQVSVGDTVTFAFAARGHGARAEVGDDGQRAFDTHPDCGPPLWLRCSSPGDQAQAFVAERPGRIAYFCPVHRGDGMTGTIEVLPAPGPSPSLTAAPSPSPTVTPEPTRSASPSPPEPSASPTATTPPTATPPPAPTVAAPPPTTPPSPDTPSPSVSASPSPSPSQFSPLPTFTEPEFDDFPDPVEPTDPVQDVSGEVAVVPAGDLETERVVWALVGGTFVLGTLGAFGRTVLSWDDDDLD